ncbi:alpha/beta fold hydrolase [Mycolicibacterium neworleansense]|uniref:Alpha/beta hydrolase fold protein n=1 Tax=Mycolicibacterium neworleansense TaxID=146018 RepID=A0A0H5RR83_9MYCO|nr:alpha/beta hydrolase [Mycolicibacterium neworleansense]MCV7361333.1 alpha/beta hydrolase [Mycolicibacterium neworleansense]CRZ16680.1 alpha/beta hydrolase fold protein [Mycolicibacterium neworleansense]
MPTFKTADSADIHYTDAGSGPVVVFTHSWGLNSGQWIHLVERLVDNGFRCVSYDRRGHGASGTYDGEWTVDLLADDLAALLEHLDLREVAMVGHSLGCGEIVRYLSRHGTARVNRAVLVAPQLPLLVETPDNPDGVPEAMLDGMLAELERDVRQWCVDNAASFFGNHVVSPEVVRWTVDQVAAVPLVTLVATQQMGAHTDYRAELAGLDLPVLVIHGDADVSAPIELTGRRTAALLPDAKLVEIPGAAHGLYVTHADRVIEAICAPPATLAVGGGAQITG